MNPIGTVKDFFKKKKKKKKPLTVEQKKQNPTNLRTGIETVKGYSARRKAMLDEMDNY